MVRGYGERAEGLASMLGVEVSPADPDRAVIEPWAATVDGRILDVGSGTGRWSGHLAALGYDVVGLEPVERFLAIARDAHPTVEFREGSFADLAASEERWAGILAWYTVIHLGPDELRDALAIFRRVLVPGGTMLVSFFTGPRLEAFDHPAATAYRWPMDDMVRTLAETGFETSAQNHTPGLLHANVTARATGIRA